MQFLAPPHLDLANVHDLACFVTALCVDRQGRKDNGAGGCAELQAQVHQFDRQRQRMAIALFVLAMKFLQAALDRVPRNVNREALNLHLDSGLTLA